MTDDLVARLRRTLAGIARDECGGDNLSILLASYFEPAIEDDELDDSGTWKQGAIDACNKVLDAIHQHYATAIEAAEARVRELEAENKRLAERLDLLAVGFGVPDGGRYIADWQTKIEKLKAAERALAEAYERAAKEAETCWVTYTGRAGDDEREQIDRARQDIATAIRNLAQEVNNEVA